MLSTQLQPVLMLVSGFVIPSRTLGWPPPSDSDETSEGPSFGTKPTDVLAVLGVYLPYYLSFDLNWQPMIGDFIELAPGLNVRHAPGHTPGLCILQVNLRESGTWVFTSDMYHVKENYESSIPQGWLMRDLDAWIRSNQMIKALVKRTQANVVLGHDMDYLAKYKNAPEFHC